MQNLLQAAKLFHEAKQELIKQFYFVLVFYVLNSNKKTGSYAQNGPKSKFLYPELKLLQSNLTGEYKPFKFKQRFEAFQSKLPADKKILAEITKMLNFV